MQKYAAVVRYDQYCGFVGARLGVIVATNDSAWILYLLGMVECSY